LLQLCGAKIDRTALVFPDVQIWAPWNLEMRARSVMGECVNCYNVGLICFEEDTSAAGFNVLCTASHDIHSEGRELVVGPIRIHRGAWLFFNSFIGPGVEIGEGSIVAAAAAVFKDVEPYSVVGGNPAMRLKERKLKRRDTQN
jgi:putative colanic acid biosynthesis acetyltransferase WcaF